LCGDSLLLVGRREFSQHVLELAIEIGGDRLEGSLAVVRPGGRIVSIAARTYNPFIYFRF
jgi:hypothetical protein